MQCKALGVRHTACSVPHEIHGRVSKTLHLCVRHYDMYVKRGWTSEAGNVAPTVAYMHGGQA